MDAEQVAAAEAERQAAQARFDQEMAAAKALLEAEMQSNRDQIERMYGNG